MRWYVVSILISYRVKEGRQNTIPVYENFTLFYANNEKEVLQKAVKYGKWCANIDDKTELDGKPAYSKYEGIRKINRKNFGTIILEFGKVTYGIGRLRTLSLIP